MAREIKSRKVNVNYEDPDWIEQVFLESLHSTLAEYERKGNPANLLRYLLIATDHYLESKAIETKSPAANEIYDIFSVLQTILVNDALGNKIKTHKNSLAIGECIEGLKYFGMPRLPATHAVSKWLGIGVSTARIHNEAYRKQYPGRFIGGANAISIYRDKMLEYINENPNFPLDHPKAKKAFNNYKASLERGITVIAPKET
jgi:hypothetical protein